MDAIADHTLPRLRRATLDIGADATRTQGRAMAWADLTGGARLWRLALTLGWLDINSNTAAPCSARSGSPSPPGSW